MAEESARRRIAVDLHDHVSQSLAVAKLRLETLREKATEHGLQEPVKEIRELINESIQQTRSLITELSPSVLYELGFTAAVEWLTEQIKTKYGVNIELKNDLQIRRIDQDIQILLFQGVRELLLNIVKHAKANHASVSIREIGDHIRIRVMDDGVGFDKARLGNGMDREGGFGLFSMRERLDHFGGRLDIHTRPGKGTSVTVEAPHKKRKKAQRRMRHVH
jgi:signal transduction histidine kinase